MTDGIERNITLLSCPRNTRNVLFFKKKINYYEGEKTRGGRGRREREKEEIIAKEKGERMNGGGVKLDGASNRIEK